MSIKFFCKCGKHLRARESLAGKRSVCPACGELVGVPSLQPTQRGTAVAPLTPAEKAILGRATTLPEPPPAEPPPSTAAGRKSWRRARRLLSLEKHWYECLRFPIYAWPMLLPLVLATTALSGVALSTVPALRSGDVPAWWVWLVCWIGPILTVGSLCGFLQCVLANAAAGETWFMGAPQPLDVLRGLAAWVVSFLAGPVVFLAAGWWFWLHGGDPTPADWLIVIELGLVGAAHWLLTLAAVHQSGRWRDANPVRVGDLIRRMGYGIVFVTLAASAVGLGCGLLILQALRYMHEESILGWAPLFLAWLAGLAWLTFFFRLLGLWCFWSRVEACHEPPPATNHAPAATLSSPTLSTSASAAERAEKI